MHGVEDLGLLKMDFLGLRNLSVIEMALDLIEQSTGPAPTSTRYLSMTSRPSRCCGAVTPSVCSSSRAPPCARRCARWHRRASTTSRRSSPCTAGPDGGQHAPRLPDLKNGRKPVTYLHPDVEAILGDTYGLMLYQESVMRVAQRFSGYTLEEADNLRKACGKKNRELIAAERKKFIAVVPRRVTARHWASSCSTSSSRSPTTPSTSPIPTGTAWSLIRRRG